MSTLADLWAALARDTLKHGDCTEAALVLADALQERGDVLGELLAVAVSEGFMVACPSNGDVEAQRIMRASHPPADMVRSQSNRWQKRRRHVACPLAPQPISFTTSGVCQCPSREPVLYREFRCMRGSRYREDGTWEEGAWTWENRYSAPEPEGYVHLRIEWTWAEEAEIRAVDNLVAIAVAMVFGPNGEQPTYPASTKDAEHFVRLEAQRYFDDHKSLPSKQHLARRLAGYLGLHELERRLSGLAPISALPDQPR